MWINLMQNIKINIHGLRFIEIETGYVAKPNRTAINRVPLSALVVYEIDIVVALSTHHIKYKTKSLDNLSHLNITVACFSRTFITGKKVGSLRHVTYKSNVPCWVVKQNISTMMCSMKEWKLKGSCKITIHKVHNYP